jgi:hypothetical protein
MYGNTKGESLDRGQALAQRKSRSELEHDLDELKKVAKSRKVAPPGQGGIESISALGNANASAISNFYCKGYRSE